MGNVINIVLLALSSSPWVAKSSNVFPDMCLEWYNIGCLGGDTALLTTGIWLRYTSNSTDLGEDEQSYSCRLWVNFNDSVPALEYYTGMNSRNITSVDYIIEQPEHGGGGCHCVNISLAKRCEFTSNSPTHKHRYST